MTRDEWLKLRLTLAADFASKCKIGAFVGELRPGVPYTKMHWALMEADQLLRAADVTEPVSVPPSGPPPPSPTGT